MALIKRGSRGAKVEDVQEMLNKVRAKPKLAVDGKFGPKTEAAVSYFQTKKSLDIDGIVGPKTSSALKRASGGPGGSGGKGSGDVAKLEKAFLALHKKLHKELKSSAHVMFITLETIKGAPGLCRKIGHEPFLSMANTFERMFKLGGAVAKKNSGFLKLLDKDADLFARELKTDPAKAKKRLLVLKNKEKQIDELKREFERATDGYRKKYAQIKTELEKETARSN